MTYIICLLLFPALWFAWRQYQQARGSLRTQMRVYGFGTKIRGRIL
ncbi:hypothetical protein UFOVP154_62 [uncultured Caudovirales phage]|uniref:Uncharacterized protein n=1 Tax=uncultured Caudovirales phage TaxID=2100421 RepID=A0A6J7WA36_9CAUD|nr:hypothetical protein UFOVP8_47 [uncultured Caudovirales phage]CAB5170995.1 hypothetical protein UFOVP154_62 [uncultured Caudovirales phage]